MSTYRIGTSGWSYTGWRGRFYPPHCPQAKWLEFYTSQFDTVELNATFYRFFKDDTFEKWYQQVPDNFKYVLKVPSYVTHRKQLLDAKDQIQAFCHQVDILKQKLGLILLQLSPRTPYELSRLEERLIDFGHYTKKLVVEFRNEKWLTEETLQLLKKHKAVFCNVDSPSIHLQTIVTSTIGYIRLHGRKKMYEYLYSTKELEEVAEQARTLNKKGAKIVYVFFNNDVNANSAKNALTLKNILEGN